MVSFDKRILFVGFGAVARCTLPILLDHIKVSPKNITIIDFEPNDAALAPWIKKGVSFFREKIEPVAFRIVENTSPTSADAAPI